jgi:hypothetical protein
MCYNRVYELHVVHYFAALFEGDNDNGLQKIEEKDEESDCYYYGDYF